MKDLKINEKKFVESIIAEKKLPEKMSVYTLETYLAKYYYPIVSEKELFKKVYGAMKDIVQDTTLLKEHVIHSKLKTLIKKFKEEPLSCVLRDNNSVCLYEEEQKIISKAKSEREKKVLAAYYFIARYLDYGGWVNTDIGYVFRCANIKATTSIQLSILHSLVEQGLIVTSKNGASLSFKVDLVPEGKVVMEIDTFDNIGHLYTGLFRTGYKNCECCMKPFKVGENARNAKYCKKCRVEQNHLRQRESYYRRKQTETDNSKVLQSNK